MDILIEMDASVAQSLQFWLLSQGHHGIYKDTQQCSHQKPQQYPKIALDYAHLRPYLWAQNPPPAHWPAAKHWLLLDAYLSHSQIIAAMQLGCRHICLAPLQEPPLTAWLEGQGQIPDLTCNGTNNLAPATQEPMLPAFVKLLMQDHWTAQQQDQAIKALAWRNSALQTPVFAKLDQTTKISPIEFAQLACHTLAASQWLSAQAQPHLALAAQVALQHHEHWDGSGYPMGIQGEAICLAARLAKLYDSYIGLRKDKAYAKACDHATSINKLMHGDGYLIPSQFDPQLLQGLAAVEEQLQQLYLQHYGE